MMGTGTFRAGADANPYVGKAGERHTEQEERLEVIFPDWLSSAVLKAMRTAHPYEEIAYDLYRLENAWQDNGSGLIGELTEPVDEKEFLQKISGIFGIPVIRHTPLRGQKLKKIAVCGGAGSFLTHAAIAAGADCYLTADIKYHEFFDADNRLILCDIGHFESEQFTSDLLVDILRQNFPNFAVLKTGVKTNPVCYFRG
jgi:putative NIF3 family GTP cyclohydrolase 1 type 2